MWRLARRVLLGNNVLAVVLSSIVLAVGVVLVQMATEAQPTSRRRLERTYVAGVIPAGLIMLVIRILIYCLCKSGGDSSSESSSAGSHEPLLDPTRARAAAREQAARVRPLL